MRLKGIRELSRLLGATVPLLLVAAGTQAHAAVIAAWEVNGLNGYGPSPFGPATTAPNTTVGGLTRGPGVDLGGTAAANAWGARGWDFNTDSGDYASFTVKANSGYQLSLSGFDPYNIRRSGTGPTSGQWQYSLNGTTFTNIGSIINWGTNTSASGNGQLAIDLTGIGALQNIPDTTTVTFRILNFNGAGTGTWYVNNISGSDLVLNGTVAASALPNINPAVASVIFPDRIVGTPATQAVALNEVGGATANYTSSFSGDATVTSGGSGSIGAGGVGSITVGLNTATAGGKNGTVTIDDGNSDADDIGVAGDVFDSSFGVFGSNGGTSLTLDFGTRMRNTGVESLSDEIINLVQTAGYTADLQFDTISGTGDTGALFTDLVDGEFPALAADPDNGYGFSAMFDTNQDLGTYSATYTLGLSDADAYVGASAAGSQTVSLTLTGRVVPEPGSMVLLVLGACLAATLRRTPRSN